MEARITFIIPSVGRISLRDTIASLQMQTHPYWKAIVAFDNVDPPENLITNDPRVTYVRRPKMEGEEQHHRAGAMRNFAIEHADTEWVAFVDDDDTLHAEYIDMFLSHVRDVPQAQCVVFRMIGCDHTPMPLPLPESRTIRHSEVGISYAMKRTLYGEGYRFPLLGTSEDFALLNTILQNGKKMVLSPYIAYFIRQQPYPNRVKVNDRLDTLN